MLISRFVFVLTTLTMISASAFADPVDAPKELDEIVIESTPLPKSIFDLAQPISLLEQKDIQEAAQSSLGETLSNQPGITSSYYGQGSSRPIIRGQSGDRVRIMQNGISVQDASSSSPDHGVALEPIQSDRIEVVRGPATLMFGPNAIGGVVNVLDNRIPDKMPKKPLEGALDLRGATVDALRSAGGKIDAPLGDNFAIHLDGFLRKTDDFSIPGFARSARLRAESPLEEGEEEAKNKRPDSATDAQGGTVGASYIFEKGFVGMAFNAFNTNYGLPSSEREVSIELHQRRFDLRGRLDEPTDSIKKIEFKSGVVDYQHRELAGSEVGTVFKNKGTDTRLDVTHAAMGPVEGLVGLQYQYSDFSAVGEEAFVTPTRTNIYSGFIFEEYAATDSFSIQAGGRLDGTDIRNIGYKPPGSEENGTNVGNADTAISGALSGVYKIGREYSTALSLTHTERAPTGTELFANGPHAGTAAFEVGDPDLGIERSLGIDLNLRKREGYVTGFVSGFYNRFNNYISLDPTGEESDELPVFNFEAFQADFFGAEAQVTAHLFGPSIEKNSQSKAEELTGKVESSNGLSDERNHLDLIAQVDFVRAYDRGDKGNVPRIPPWRLLLATDYQRESFGARAEVQHVFQQDSVANFETDTDGYTLVNLILTKDLPLDFANSTLFLRANNIFDEEARSHVSFLKDLTPLPGRNAMAGIRFTF